MNGHERGADAYISKPFDIHILEKKIENLLASRDTLREKYSRELVLMPSRTWV